jgi:outer membrane protein OmpA-like peptidoglycan-associated protein
MKPFKSAALAIIIGCLSLTLHAQDNNLVLNFSFEEYEKCPENYTPMDNTHKLIPFWTYPTFATPDYFNRCSSGPVTVPANFAGKSEPKTGDAYMGSILSGTSESYREYFQGELREPMIEGKQYCVTFSYRLASYSQIAVDQLSVFLSEEETLVEGKEALGRKPQIRNKDGLFLDNVEGWKEMCRVHVASGGEKYFIIGNFNNYDNTNYVVVDKTVVNLRDKAYAYYYFDDISIKPLENCNDCPCVQQDFETAFIDTFYTGGKDPVTGNVDQIVNDGRISIGIYGGTEPYTVTWSNGATGTSLNNLPAGTYSYQAQDKFNCKSSGEVTFIEPEIKKDEFSEGLQNIEEGAAIILENIFFEFNKTALLPESYEELDKVVSFIKENDIKKIEISGHTDSEGSDSYNQKLSEGRAKSVVNYLTQQGVVPEKLIAVGYGEARPIDTNTSEEGKAKNRRVEFRLLKK